MNNIFTTQGQKYNTSPDNGYPAWQTSRQPQMIYKEVQMYNKTRQNGEKKEQMTLFRIRNTPRSGTRSCNPVIFSIDSGNPILCNVDLIFACSCDWPSWKKLRPIGLGYYFTMSDCLTWIDDKLDRQRLVKGSTENDRGDCTVRW